MAESTIFTTRREINQISDRGVALGYDAQGNVAFKNGSRYRFDMGNRLRDTAGETYRYDAEGRRVRSERAGGQVRESDYAKDGRLVWQRDEVAGQRRVNVYLSGSLVADYSRPLAANTVTVSYIHTDALGSPIAKTDASGAVIETSEYEPYGKLLNRPNDDRAGYTGHVMDSASGLTYMQQRYYDPMIGRFLSVDPVTANSSTGSNFNRYWYAANNPYRFIDPDGRQAKSGGSKQCGDQPCPEPPKPEAPKPPPSKPVDPATVPRRTVGTVEKPTPEEAAQAARSKIRGLQRRSDQEYCGTICPAPNNNTFIVVITTNDATSACYAEPCAGSQQGDNPTIHNHPNGPVKLTPADQMLSNGQRPAGFIFTPSRGFSGSDYSAGPGYLILGNKLYYQNGTGTDQEVK